MGGRAVLALTVVLALLGCGQQSFDQIKPDLEMANQALNFGDVALGVSSPSQSVQLQAVTEAAIALTVSIEGDSAGVFAVVPAAPATVPPRGKASVSVVFTPKAVQPYAATLVIQTNDPKNKQRTVPLTGTGASAAISVLPMQLALTAVACPAGLSGVAACSDSQAVTITNAGLVSLHVTAISLVASGTDPLPANLTLSMPPATPVDLVAGDHVAVAVLWQPAPSETGSFTANLEIESDDPAHPSTIVPITAQATAVQPPHVCVSPLSVDQNEFTVDNMGNFNATLQPVPAVQWLDAAGASIVHVSPGWQVTLTSLVTSDSSGSPEVDTSTEMSSPCTYDPQGSPLTYAWTIVSAPAGSHAVIAAQADGAYPGIENADGVISVDEVGQYELQLQVTNSFSLSATATYALDAQPHDDLLAQIQWTSPVMAMGTAEAIDLDLHLVVDSGPGIAGTGTLLSTQDCYWQNANPTWFTPSNATEMPRLLRDDQGESGGFESTDLETAPLPSSYRAVVHYFAGQPASPVALGIYYQGTLIGGPYMPSRDLNENDVWIGAQVVFPSTCPVGCTSQAAACCPPTVTSVDTFCTLTPGVSDGMFTGTVSCPGGTTL